MDQLRELGTLLLSAQEKGLEGAAKTIRRYHTLLLRGHIRHLPEASMEKARLMLKWNPRVHGHNTIQEVIPITIESTGHLVTNDASAYQAWLREHAFTGDTDLAEECAKEEAYYARMGLVKKAPPKPKPMRTHKVIREERKRNKRNKAKPINNRWAPAGVNSLAAAFEMAEHKDV